MHEDELKDSRILIVEDKEANIRFLTRLLNKVGYRNVESTQDSREAQAVFRRFKPDLVLLDLHMPHMDGFDVMKAIGPDIPERSFLPILVITADREPEVRIRCLSMGAKDFISKPFRAEEALVRIRNLLETRRLHRFLEFHNETLQVKVEIENSRVQATQLEVLHRLAVAAEYRDDITGQHAARVGLVASVLAKAAGLSCSRADRLREAAPLHDVGKIGIPDAILLKPGKLTDEEFETMRTHTTIGGLILSKGSFPLLDDAREIALSHHEWWDGSGYPKGLVGDAIPFSGRIVAIADVFDSLTHDRPYKRAFSVDEALEIMLGEGDRHFDPELLELFVDLVRRGRISPDEEVRTNQVGAGAFGPLEGATDPLRAFGFEKPDGLSPEAERLLSEALDGIQPN
jgi:putative two-component system response regulator